MMTSTDSELEDARQRVIYLFKNLRASGSDLGQFGEDVDLLLNVTAPREQQEVRQLPKPRPVWERIRRTDPSTSWEAGRRLSPESTRELYNDIIFVMWNNVKLDGLTDEELIFVLTEQMFKKYTPSGIRSRRSELVEAGWLRDSGQRRNTKAGRPAIVWEWVPSVDS